MLLATTLRQLSLFVPRRCLSSSLSLSASPPPFRVLFIGSGEFGLLTAVALRRSEGECVSSSWLPYISDEVLPPLTGICSTFNVLTTADVPTKWKRVKQRAPVCE